MMKIVKRRNLHRGKVGVKIRQMTDATSENFMRVKDKIISGEFKFSRGWNSGMTRADIDLINKIRAKSVPVVDPTPSCERIAEDKSSKIYERDLDCRYKCINKHEKRFIESNIEQRTTIDEKGLTHIPGWMIGHSFGYGSTYHLFPCEVIRGFDFNDLCILRFDNNIPIDLRSPSSYIDRIDEKTFVIDDFAVKHYFSRSGFFPYIRRNDREEMNEYIRQKTSDYLNSWNHVRNEIVIEAVKFHYRTEGMKDERYVARNIKSLPPVIRGRVYREKTIKGKCQVIRAYLSRSFDGTGNTAKQNSRQLIALGII